MGDCVENTLSGDATPNLFLVGAPKCGTTSMYEYLRQHPQIFFPVDENDYWRSKEPNHLCPELEIQEKYSIKDRRDYLNLYTGSEGAAWRGDASPYYLFSESAPERIKQLCPNARILVMLRPPVEMMRSYHRDLLRIHLDDTVDFYDAINAGVDRKGGLFIRHPGRRPKYLDYFSISRFAPQVQRYQQIFGRASIKVVLLEDMVAVPEKTFSEILAFLEVESSFRPDLRVHNETPRHGILERVVTSVYEHPAVRRVTQIILPYAVRRKFLSFIRRAERGIARPDQRDGKLRELCRADVERLSTLIGRDLSHWQ